MLINDLFELNKRLSSNLWDIARENEQPHGLSPRLILPKKRNNDIRISEQEARVLYCNLLNQSSYYYSIETPTTQTYIQKGKGQGRSANTDLSLYEYNGNKFNKTVNVEFKGPNTAVEDIRKDIEKIIKEGIIGNWFHTIKNMNSGTLSNLFDKFIDSLNQCSSFVPQDKDISILFCFCVLEKKCSYIQHFLYEPTTKLTFNNYVKVFFKIPTLQISTSQTQIPQIINPQGWYAHTDSNVYDRLKTTESKIKLSSHIKNIIDEMLSLMELQKGELPEVEVDKTSAPGENIFQLKALNRIPSVKDAPEELKHLYDIPGEYRTDDNINILDLLGVYKSGEHKVILYDLLIKLCSIQLDIDYKGLKTVVLYHELAHALTHRGLDENKEIWESFDIATSEDKEYFAQIYTYKLLEKKGRIDLIDIMDRLSVVQPHIYRTYNNSKHKSIEEINIVLLEKRRLKLEGVRSYGKPSYKVNQDITVRFIISQYDSWRGTEELSLLMEYSANGHILYKKEKKRLKMMNLGSSPIDKTNMKALPHNVNGIAMDLISLLMQPNINMQLSQSSSNTVWAHPTDYIIDVLESNLPILHWEKSFGGGGLNNYNGIFKDILAIVIDIINNVP